MSVLAYLKQQVEEATTDAVRAQCQRVYDDYAAVIDQINAAEAVKDTLPIGQAG